MQTPVRAMLLCGSDLVESFLKTGVWKPEHVKAIFEEHGVVCISRQFLLFSPPSKGQRIMCNELYCGSQVDMPLSFDSYSN